MDKLIKQAIFNDALAHMLEYMRDTNNAERHLSIARHDFEKAYGELSEEQMGEWQMSIEMLWDELIAEKKTMVAQVYKALSG